MGIKLILNCIDSFVKEMKPMLIKWNDDLNLMVKDWLLHHILEVDMKMGNYISRKIESEE